MTTLPEYWRRTTPHPRKSWRPAASQFARGIVAALMVWAGGALIGFGMVGLGWTVIVVGVLVVVFGEKLT
jgi:hypothetical protein